MENIRIAIGRRLQETRKSAGFKQAAAAKELGVNRQTVSGWECGRGMPRSTEWYKIGLLYGASLDYLVYGIRTMPVSKYAMALRPQPDESPA